MVDNTPIININSEQLIRRLFIGCVVIEMALVIFDLTINFASWSDHFLIQRMFNIAREDSIASWFGTTQTFVAALTLFLIYRINCEQPNRSVRLSWLVLALFFLYLAFDDGVQLHERVGSFIHTTFGGRDNPISDSTLLNQFPSFTWQLFFLPIFVLIGLYMFYFLWTTVNTVNQRMVLVSAFALLSLGVVLDFFEGLSQEHPLNIYTWMIRHFELSVLSESVFNSDPFEMLQHFSRVIEEFVEMFAFTLLWMLFLQHLTTQSKRFTIQFD